jgi:hypothetical protein
MIKEKWKYKSCLSWKDNCGKIYFFSILKVRHRMPRKPISSINLRENPVLGENPSCRDNLN